MKICPAGAELFHADRRLNEHELIVAFQNFVKGQRMSDAALQP
jgi:hypothetical protein